MACADGTGGAIVVWIDRRSPTADTDVYAQRIDATGSVMPGWPATGIRLGAGAGDELDPRCIADGEGGAWVAWTDLRDGVDVRATRLDADSVAANWPAAGVIVCGATGIQTDAVVAADGAGGAYIAWSDARSDANDIYVHHLTPVGLDPAWPANGLAVCNADGGQRRPALAAVPAGGAVVVWEDTRGGDGINIWGQRIAAGGAGMWWRNGVAVCNASRDQDRARVCLDARSGVFVVWQDQRSGRYDVYGIRLNMTRGESEWPWPFDGAALAPLAAPRFEPEIAPDGDGGAYVTWFDRRYGDLDVFALRIAADGSEAPGWTRSGVPVCVAPGDQIRPQLATAPGAVWITWTDVRGADGGDISVQRLTRGGRPHGCWPAQGTTLAAPHEQRTPVVVPAAAGALIAWVDARARTDTDVYVSAIGAEPETGLWAPDGNLIAAAPGEAFFTGPVTAVGTVTPDGNGGAFAVWEEARNGDLDPWIQHVRADGSLAPGWLGGGMPVAQASGEAGGSCVVRDGAGGVFVAWHERRVAPVVDVFVQRLDAQAAIAPGWPAGGRSVCDAPARVRAVPCLAAAAGGGVVVAWQEWDGIDLDVRAQRLTGDGQIASGWPADGVHVCDAAGTQCRVAILAIATGFLFAWQDERSGPDADIYGLGLTPQGRLLTGWTFDGVRLCGARGKQNHVRLASDAAGGAFVAWRDQRTLPERAYGTHINRDGSLARGWPLDGIALDAGVAPVYALSLAPDARGGMIAAWATHGAAPGVRVTRRDADGLPPPGWPAAPLALRDGLAVAPALASDGAGGATVIWVDGRRGEADLFAQHVDALGVVSGAAGGSPVCVAPGCQMEPVLAGESGCVLALWKDARGADADLFAARVSADALAARRAWTAGDFEAGHAAADALHVAAAAAAAPRLVAGPNPMRDRTRLVLRGVADGSARVAIFDARGRLVRDLGVVESGGGDWDGRDTRGARVAAGTYLARARATAGVTMVAKIQVQR